MTILASSAIQDYLPHRYPFLLIDKVLTIVPGKTIVAIKNVSINELFFQGHFPEDPIMPGVLILEAMAQASSILASYPYPPQKLTTPYKYVLVAVDGIKFKKPVMPGDQLQISAVLQWQRGDFSKYQVQATVDGQLVCLGDMTGTKQFSKKVLPK